MKFVLSTNKYSSNLINRIRQKRDIAFTLIELLIVVAIISILAALAIPNYLNAQTRSKVARAKGDMASITTALELFAADNNDYPPNDGRYNVTPVELTTPIAYLASRRIIDPFADKIIHPIWGEESRLYTYAQVVNSPLILPPPPVEGIDSPMYNLGAFDKYGKWYQLSLGPDCLYSGMDEGLGEWPCYLFDMPYDPTNGIVSFGNILRTQKESLIK